VSHAVKTYELFIFRLIYIALLFCTSQLQIASEADHLTELAMHLHLEFSSSTDKATSLGMPIVLDRSSYKKIILAP
jgi:hypothetical protein